MSKKSFLATPKGIDRIISKWRKILGVDPVYVVQWIEDAEDTGYPARVDGLSLDNPHPSANILINSAWLQQHKNNEYKIVSLIVHELLHIVIMDAFMMIDPAYKYEGIKARANETLTMKMTNAIMTTYYGTNADTK